MTPATTMGQVRGGDEILLAARIIAVADTFDAITTNRPYQAAHAPEYAVKIRTFVSGDDSASWRVASSPSIPGMRTSMITTSASSPRARRAVLQRFATMIGATRTPTTRVG